MERHAEFLEFVWSRRVHLFDESSAERELTADVVRQVMQDALDDFRERVRLAVLRLLEAIDHAGRFFCGQFSPIQCLAEDVAAYLGKISGAEVRVVDQPVAGLLPIFVGCAPEEVKLTKATEFGDTSVVDVTAQRIVLHGESRRVPWTKDCPRYFALGIKDVSIESAKVFTASTWGMHRILTPKVMAELAERGYVTLAPDYPYLGENKFDPYQNGYVSCTMKGIWNHMRAIDLLQSLTEVDGQRIGVIGHSLGGHNSLFLAAYDERVRCVVSCCGYGTNEEYVKKHKFTGGEGVRYYPRIKELTDGDVQRMPFDLVEIAATLAPRPFLTVAPLRDSNFPVKGLTDAQHALTPLYKLLAAKDRLTFDFPDTEHTFPRSSRDKAYTWLDRWLKPNEARPSATGK